MYRRIITALFFGIVTLSSNAQIYDPVSWDFSYLKSGDKSYDIVLTATIEKGSHIYAMDVPAGGPIPTSIRIDSTGNYTIDGKPFEVTKPEEILDEAFGFKIKIFSGKAEFRQKITGITGSFTVKGTVSFMSCNNSTCSPPRDVDFEIGIGDKKEVAAIVSGPDTDIKSAKTGILKFFLTSFLLGLIGVLTPCVYPMIPMTVAFFTRGSEERRKTIINALIFGISIVVIYTLPGLIISLTGAGAGFASTLSDHWIPNTVFFLLFVIFAVSFFGAFELVLPNKWASSADSKVDRGGLFASFFMALTTVIVSFSCTGPIVGGLLVEAASGDVLRPTVGMFAFGLAFALPFTLFALFPALLSKLPKSGGWLNSIKVVLGFLMLAFSMKFLMAIDNFFTLRMISRDIFLAVWIVLFSLLGLYLAGKIRFAHDSEVKNIGAFRLFLIIIVFSFVVYLVPGLFGAPLKGIAAFLPPQETSWFANRAVISGDKVPSLPSITGSQCSEPKYSDRFNMPLGLTGYFDYKQGLECAREQNKPVLLDFKGKNCSNCKLMEARVWSDPEVLQRLKDNFIIIALYVDDRTELPENEWITSKVDGKVKKRVGLQNEDLEISKFSTNALPLYAICDLNGNKLVKPMPTNTNVSEYKKWLDDGLRAFRQGR